MARLSPEQIASAAYQAGFRGPALSTITAIALAESRGNPSAVNPSGEHSVGLTQVNMRAHGNRFGSEAQLKDPVANMRAAYQLSNGGQTFQPWTTYTGATSHGASNPHTRFLGQAQQAAAKVSGGESVAVPKATAGAPGTSPAQYGGGPAVQPVQQGPSEEEKAQQEHQQLVMDVISDLTRQRQQQRKMAQRPVSRQGFQFQPDEFLDPYQTRLKRLRSSTDLTPPVMQRPAPTRDEEPQRRSMMLTGIQEHLRRAPNRRNPRLEEELTQLRSR